MVSEHLNHQQPPAWRQISHDRKCLWEKQFQAVVLTVLTFISGKKWVSSNHLASTQLICFPPIINCWARGDILQTALNLFIFSSLQFILNILFPCLSDYITPYALFWGTAVAQWLRFCATNRKVTGSIPDGVIGIFHWRNPSDRTMALGLTQPITEISTRSISWGVKSGQCLRLTTLPPSWATVT